MSKSLTRNQSYQKKHIIAVAVFAFLLLTAIGTGMQMMLDSQITTGSIPLSDDLLSTEMMAHIAANYVQLAEPNGPFIYQFAMAEHILTYTDGTGLDIMITISQNNSPADILAAEPHLRGDYFLSSDPLMRLIKANKYDTIFRCYQGPLDITVTCSDAPDLTDSPLRMALSIIEGAIGTP